MLVTKLSQQNASNNKFIYYNILSDCLLGLILFAIIFSIFLCTKYW